MDQKTIVDVDEQVNEWTSDDGTIHLNYIQGGFADGDRWSVGVKPENTGKIKAKLEGLVGTEASFKLEHKGRRDGHDEWKLNDYPGKLKGSIPYPSESQPSPVTTTANASGNTTVTYTDPSRGSIEAQVAAKIAGEIASDHFGTFANDEQIWGFIEAGTKRLAAAIREAAQGSPQEPAKEVPVAEDPEPEPEPQEPSERQDRATLLDEALRVYSNGKGIVDAWLVAYGEDRGVVDVKLSEITDDELAELAGL